MAMNLSLPRSETFAYLARSARWIVDRNKYTEPEKAENLKQTKTQHHNPINAIFQRGIFPQQKNSQKLISSINIMNSFSSNLVFCYVSECFRDFKLNSFLLFAWKFSLYIFLLDLMEASLST